MFEKNDSIFCFKKGYKHTNKQKYKTHIKCLKKMTKYSVLE